MGPFAKASSLDAGLLEAHKLRSQLSDDSPIVEEDELHSALPHDLVSTKLLVSMQSWI